MRRQKGTSRRAFVACGVCAGCAGLVGVPWAWAQGLVICKSCGREAKDGETVCSRCGTALPPPRKEAAPAQAAAVDASAEVVKMAAAAVEANYRLAREAEEAVPSVAQCYYQNAMAVMRLVPAGQLPKEVGDALLAGRGRTFHTVMTGWVKCKACKGSGKYQGSTMKALPGVVCPACKGKGGGYGLGDVPQAKAVLLQGRNEFERRQMLAGEVRLGRAFVPAALEKLLTPPQRALVMTGMQVPCDSCQGAARQVCTACKGSRWVKCPNTACRNGEVEPPQRKAGDPIPSKRINEEVVTRCPRCGGLAEVPCAPCEGNGSVPCQSCAGSGVAPRCARCSGTGLQECTKCKGSGKVKDAPCADCGGGGIVLCVTCRGEGAKTK